MLSWGEDCQRGFSVKGGAGGESISSDPGVHRLELGCQVSDVSAGRRVLAFVVSNGDTFITRINESQDGTRVRGKQKFVKCKEKIEAVSCGDDLVALLSKGGRLLCVDTTLSPFIPRPLEGFSNITISQVACGSQHSVALTKGGQVFTWGQNSRGQLGLGKRKAGAGSPQQLRALSAIPVVHVAAGGEQSFALSVSGGVFGWGGNHCGQLGLGDTTDRHMPTSVQCLNMKKTSQISCGTDHTAILTKHGAVFTFGSGQHGQLGHNSSRNELRPRLVAELWGAKVTKIACGRHHTLVLTEAKRIYSFGCGDQGQLRHGEESHASVPLPVQLPQDTSDGQIRNIFAGENCSFAMCSSDQDSNTDSVSRVTQTCLDGMIDKWTSECESKSWKKIKMEIHQMFKSASCLNKSFLENREKHFQTSPKYHGLNLLLAEASFKELVKKEKLWLKVEAVILQLLPSLDENPIGVEGLRIYLLLNELLHVIQTHTYQQSTRLAVAAAAAVTGLSKESLQVIGNWWSSLLPSTMTKYVKAWKQALTVILSYDRVPRSSGVRNLLLVLQYMYNVNSTVEECQRIPESVFCLEFRDMFLGEEVVRWHSQKRFGRAKQTLVLCNFPIVLDLQSKKKVFDMSSFYTKFTEVNDIINQRFGMIELSPLRYREMSFVLDLERASVLEDTFKQLTDCNQTDYKRPLVVVFDKNNTIDEVFKKDFFYKVFHEMVSAESGMFMFNDSETLAWFSSRATQEDQRFLKLGLLCGLALYNQCIVHLPFPLVLFKKLLGVKPSLEDMMEFSPSVAESLQSILNDYSDDVIENLDMDFHINWDDADVDLDPENPEKMLTGQNKKEFVDAYVNHAFNTSVDAMFQDFKQGFFQVCDWDIVKLFRPKELRELMVGKDLNDWEKLKQSTVYKGEYHVAHPTIQMFWEVFDELSEDQKRALLWFVTGFERLPIVGEDKIKMKVGVKNVNDCDNDQYYPETHTCFSLLELPLYSTKEIMKTKLIEALNNNLGIYR